MPFSSFGYTLNTNMARKSNPIKSWPDRTNLVLGVLLCLSPWLAPSDHAAIAWNAVIFGAAIAVAAGFAIAKPSVVPEWTNVALGMWLLIAPWALGFAADTGAVWASVLVGLFVVYFAGTQIVLLKRPPATRRAFRVR